jgi:hypothetical protein
MSSVLSEPLVFEPAEHRYFLRGQELISVTQTLKIAGLVEDRFYTEEARQRGVYVHQACQLLDEGDLDWQGLDPVLRPYVEAYQDFLRVARPLWVFIEHRVYDEVRGYAGTLDRAGLVFGRTEPLIIDIKTGSLPPFVGPQTAAYRRCLPESHTWRRAALHLRSDGSFSLVPLDDRHDESVFLAALTVAQWKRRAGWNS